MKSVPSWVSLDVDPNNVPLNVDIPVIIDQNRIKEERQGSIDFNVRFSIPGKSGILAREVIVNQEQFQDDDIKNTYTLSGMVFRYVEVYYHHHKDMSPLTVHLL